MSYYAVAVGRVPGIYRTWDECRLQVNSVSGARFKKFNSYDEATKFITVENPSMPKKDHQVIWTDGSCLGNGTAEATGGYGVYFAPNDPRNIAAALSGPDQTNNTAELTAIKAALDATMTIPSIEIKSDSTYSIKAITTWLPKWRDRNFKTTKGDPVKNQALIEAIDNLLTRRDHLGYKTVLTHVYGHAGDHGNESADALARIGSNSPRPS